MSLCNPFALKLTSTQKALKVMTKGKTDEWMDERTGGQMDGGTDRWTDRQLDRRTDRWTDEQTDRQTRQTDIRSEEHLALELTI